MKKNNKKHAGRKFKTIKKTFPQVLYFRRGAPSHFMVSFRIGLLARHIYCAFAADFYQLFVWCTSAEIECLLNPPMVKTKPSQNEKALKQPSGKNT
jgi:hypothetical protein